jgi:hypothetical protein
VFTLIQAQSRKTAMKAIAPVTEFPPSKSYNPQLTMTLSDEAVAFSRFKREARVVGTFFLIRTFLLSMIVVRVTASS